MVRLAAHLEEVLDRERHSAADDVLAQFLAHLAHDGAGRVLARLDATAGQRPGRVVRQTVQQDGFIPDEDGRGTHLEAVGADVDGDYAGVRIS